MLGSFGAFSVSYGCNTCIFHSVGSTKGVDTKLNTIKEKFAKVDLANAKSSIEPTEKLWHLQFEETKVH